MSNATATTAAATTITGTITRCGTELLPPDPTLYGTPALDIHDIAWLTSGIATVIAIVLSLFLICQHLLNFNHPRAQRHIIRLLFMVPIYALDSWVSFRFYYYSTYIDLARDAYEAFAIYTFVALCLEYLGGEESVEEILKDKEILKMGFPFGRVKLPPPRFCGKSYLHRCKQGALQYVLIRPVTAIIAVILEATGYYCSGSVKFQFGWIYITIVLFISVTVAMYALICVYTNLGDDLKPYKPLLQFGSVKFVIFVSFWQSIVVAGLVYVNLIKATSYWTTDNISEGIQDFLICCEMLLISLVHIKAFSWKPYIAETRTNIIRSFIRTINVWDIAKDTQKHFVPTGALTVTVQKYNFGLGSESQAEIVVEQHVIATEEKKEAELQLELQEEIEPKNTEVEPPEVKPSEAKSSEDVRKTQE